MFISETRCRRRRWPCRALPFPGPGPTAEQALAAVEQAAKTRTDWVTAYIGPLIARDRRNWRKALDAGRAERAGAAARLLGPHDDRQQCGGWRRLASRKNVADPVGGWWGRDKDGRLDGRAYEAAEEISNCGRAPPDAARARRCVRCRALHRYARWGVTSIHLMNSGKSARRDRPRR